MKILFVTQSLGKGGAERLVLEITHAMKKDFPQVEVKIVSLDRENDFTSLSQGLDIEYCNSKVQLSITGKSTIEINEYEEIVDRYQPHVIHSHTYKAELVSRENPRQGIKYITHVHGPFPEFEPFSLKTLTSKVSLARLYERIRILKRYRKIDNKFITISRAIDVQIRNQLGRNWHKNILLIPNAINFMKFNSLPHPPEKNNIELISVGRMFLVKNHEYLLKVILALKNIAPNYNWRLLIAGDGPLKSDLNQQIVELDLQEQLLLPGKIESIEIELKKSHIYVHSAISEPFGLTLLEAMAASLPVVSLDGGGNRDFIENKLNGFILPQTTTPESFAQKIINVVENKDLYLDIANSANKTAKKYDIHAYIQRLFLFYNS